MEGTSRGQPVHHLAQFDHFQGWRFTASLGAQFWCLTVTVVTKCFLYFMAIPKIPVCVCCLSSRCYTSKECLALPLHPPVRQLKTAPHRAFSSGLSKPSLVTSSSLITLAVFCCAQPSVSVSVLFQGAQILLD